MIQVVNYSLKEPYWTCKSCLHLQNLLTLPQRIKSMYHIKICSPSVYLGLGKDSFKIKAFQREVGAWDDLDIKGPVKENPDHFKKQSKFFALVFITEKTID